MAAKKPWKYFPHVLLPKISFRKPSAWEDRRKNDEWRPHFDTWEEAHSWMLARAARRVEKSKKNLKAAQREAKNAPVAYESVAKMWRPEISSDVMDGGGE